MNVSFTDLNEIIHPHMRYELYSNASDNLQTNNKRQVFFLPMVKQCYIHHTYLHILILCLVVKQLRAVKVVQFNDTNHLF